MNCGLQFGQVVAWCSHKSTWQQSSSASDRACHQVASDVNTRGAREKRGVGGGGRWVGKEVQLISWMEHENKRKNNFWSILCMITGNGCSLKRLSPSADVFFLSPSLSLFSVAFLAAIKRQNKNYAVTPLWLPDNNPLLLLCASFILKTSKFSFSKIFNFIFEAWQ